MIYEARCVSDIFFKDKIYRAGDTIRLNEKDKQELLQAGVIGAVGTVDKEYAVSEPPEIAMVEHGKNRKRGR